MQTASPTLNKPHARAAKRDERLAAAAFSFRYGKPYGGVYTNRHERLVLREEHAAELKRLVAERNRAHEHKSPLSVSDVVNAALDFAFEHPVALANVESPEGFRDAFAGAVYRKALLHFIRHGGL